MEMTTRECKSQRCRADVVDLLVVGQTGGHRAEVFDPKPATWADGGRVRLLSVQPGVAKHPLARRLAHGGQAFGAGPLYRPHKETCAGGRGSTARSREANG